MTVSAPFRFAPINRWVHFPAWRDLVTHDIPFADGVSGQIIFDARAETPLLVGGLRRVGGANREGEVRPFQLADGRYAIPGSSWQGLFRSILEIAAFGKLGERVEERRFGYRSLANDATSRIAYRSRMVATAAGPQPNAVTQHARAGWLIKSETGPVIVRCDFARIEFSDVAALRSVAGGTGPNSLSDRSDAKARYDWFLNGRSRSALNATVHVDLTAGRHVHAQGSIALTYRKAHPTALPATSPTAGTIVLTGKTRNGEGPGQKHMEFVFHTPDRSSAAASTGPRLEVAKDVWRDFDLIHDEQLGQKPNPNWAYWKADFEDGVPVPVFYLEEKDRAGQDVLSTFGTAFMFKTAQPLSTHQMLRHSSEDHFSPQADLPALIFGAVAGNDGSGLKRRASFDLSVATLPQGAQPRTSNATVLLGPKPSYFPLYVRQPGASNTLPNGQPFATYDDHSAGRYQPPAAFKRDYTEPELMGVKVWPATAAGSRFPVLPDAPPPPRGQAPNLKVQVRLKALPAETRFQGATIRFHNLREVELGALLWALTLGETEKLGGYGALRHRIGMGKPYGLGAISISVRDLQVAHAVQPVDPIARMKAAMDAFVAHMRSAYAASGDAGDWEESVQVRTLRKAADPAANTNQSAFTYMNLGEADGPDGTYLTERAAGRFLPRYAAGGEAPRSSGGPSLVPRGGRSSGGSQSPPLVDPRTLMPHEGAMIFLPVRDLKGQIISACADAKGRWRIRFEDNSEGLLKPALFKVIAAAQ